MGVRPGFIERALLPAGACLIACIAFFGWAAARGYDINDESYYLIWDSAPFSYRFSLSLFGYLWHPVYRLVGGDIALLRIAGAAVLLACSATFAFALGTFIDLRSGRERHLVVLSVCTSAFWLFVNWLTIPGYNELNLSALLLFVSGLLLAAGGTKDGHAPTIRSALLSGAGLGIMALVKPTTCAVAVVMALAWLALLRPPRPLALALVSATAAIAVVLTAAVLIDGSFSIFLQRELSNLAIARLSGPPGDVHGVVGSVVGPFAAHRIWKIFPAVAIGAAIFAGCLGIITAGLGLMRIDKRLQRLISVGLTVALAVYIALARSVDPQPTIAWYNYHAWYVMPLFLAAAIAVVLARIEHLGGDPVRRRYARAAAIVAALPLAYSLGTNVPLLRHMVGASIFWAGAAVLAAALGSPARRAQLIGILSLVIATTTVGLLAGISHAPAWPAVPLIQQTEPVRLGPDSAQLLMDRARADYIRSLQRAAVGAGFKPGTAVIDLTETGPGILFALSGKAVGSPWLADTPDGSMALAVAVLKSIPKSELQHAWIITGSEQNLASVRGSLEPFGLGFPATYHRVIAARLDAFGWRHTLWKPAVR